MNVSESVWYKAKSLDGVYDTIFEGDYFRTYDSVEDIKKALEKHVIEWNIKGQTFLICKETLRIVHDENGKFVRQEDLIETVEEWRAA